MNLKLRNISSIFSGLFENKQSVFHVLAALSEFIVDFLTRMDKTGMVCINNHVYLRDTAFYEPDKIIGKKHNIYIDHEAAVEGGTFDTSTGSIHIGKRVKIEAGCYIRGPAIIHDDSTIRFGAYLRGNVLIGSHTTIRCELKHVLIMNHCSLSHPGYCGDSICGNYTHFGNRPLLIYH